MGKAALFQLNALQAGQKAKIVFAYADARAYFNRALALQPQTALHVEQETAHLPYFNPQAIAANRRLRVQALYGRGWAFRLLGDMEAYEHDSQEVARLAELLNDQRTLAHSRWRKAYTHRFFAATLKPRRRRERESVWLRQRPRRFWKRCVIARLA